MFRIYKRSWNNVETIFDNLFKHVRRNKYITQIFILWKERGKYVFKRPRLIYRSSVEIKVIKRKVEVK